jgi:hypothetical protein
MKYIFLRPCLLLIAFFSITTVKAQSLKSLEDNNGFKKYKLASKFVLGLGIKNKDAEGADKIVIDYANETIGDIPVRSIELYYLKDTLAKIIVKVPPEYYEKLNEALRNSFGQPTQDFSKNEKVNFDTAFSANYYKDDFLWKATRIRLQYLYTYPKASGGGYGAKNLQLVYSLNDYGQRLQRAKKGVSSAKNF